MSKVKKLTYTGTGAALVLEMGFVPKIAKIYDDFGNLCGTYLDGMSDGEALLSNEYIDAVTTSPAPSIGTTAANIANKAFQIRIAGIGYNVAAVAAGTAPTATTIPQNTWGAFGWEVAADGTLDSGWDAAANATGYASEALAIAAIKAVAASASHVRAFYVTVMRTNAAGFVGATTAFSDSETTYNCYNFSDLRIYSGGFTKIEASDYITSGTVLRVDGTSETASSSNILTARGLQISTSTYLNTSGRTYTVEAINE